MTLEEAAKAFEEALRTWKKEHPTGRIIITQGIGSDGHTAGIMPYPGEGMLFDGSFDDKTRWVAAYDAGNKSSLPKRITVTLPFLRHMVDVSIVLASGSEKLPALKRTLAPNGSLSETPARIIGEMREVLLFTELPLIARE
jgi:6-phosphogluconolactonase/glucosamine-6-phosphate isomerase/deaminase